MRTIISQSVVLPAPAESLFEMYTDPAKHAVITGAPVAISIEPGSALQWRAHRCDAPDHPSTLRDPILALDQI